MNNSSIFYIVRHAETKFNVSKILQGHLDSSLTKHGVSETKKLGLRFKNINFDLVFSSDLLRAKRTAEIILLERELAVQTTAVLRERFYGKFEGKSIETLKTYRKLISKLKEEGKAIPKNNSVEADENVISRLITFLRETAIAYPNKTILVVTHGGAIRLLLQHLGQNLEFVTNLGYAILETDGVDFDIKQMEGVI